MEAAWAPVFPGGGWVLGRSKRGEENLGRSMRGSGSRHVPRATGAPPHPHPGAHYTDGRTDGTWAPPRSHWSRLPVWLSASEWLAGRGQTAAAGRAGPGPATPAFLSLTVSLSPLRQSEFLPDTSPKDSTFLLEMQELRSMFLQRPGCPQFCTRATSMSRSGESPAGPGHAALPAGASLPGGQGHRAECGAFRGTEGEIREGSFWKEPMRLKAC